MSVVPRVRLAPVSNHPTLPTARLLLRPFALADAPEVRRLAGDREVAATTLRIPHPYPEGAAEEWIAAQKALFDDHKEINFAVVLRAGQALLGAIGLMLRTDDSKAELGYWIGRPYWGQGFCTEAARAIVRYGFEDLGLNRIYAHHMAHNPASGRVMEKLGMTREGRLRQHVAKWGRFEDVVAYGILREEYPPVGQVSNPP